MSMTIIAALGIGIAIVAFIVGLGLGLTAGDISDEFPASSMEAEYKRRLNRICELETPKCSHVVRKAVRIARGETL